MTPDWLKDPAWWAFIIALVSAAFTGIAARAAASNARISKADALVCRVDLQLSPGHDNEAMSELGMRHGVLTNMGEEVAVNVRLLQDGSDVEFEEFNGRTLNQGQSIPFNFFPPNPYPSLPPGGVASLSRPLSHYLQFEFQRPKGLGGTVMRKEFRYEKYFQGYQGDKAPGTP